MVASQGAANALESEGGASHLRNHGLHTRLLHQLGLVPLPEIGEEGQLQPQTPNLHPGALRDILSD